MFRQRVTHVCRKVYVRELVHILNLDMRNVSWRENDQHVFKSQFVFTQKSFFIFNFLSAIPSIIPSSRQRCITSLILSVNLEVTKNRYPRET